MRSPEGPGPQGIKCASPDPVPRGKVKFPIRAHALAAIAAGTYAGWMDKVSACDVPEGSLLAGFGAPQDYRDCFCRVLPGAMDLGTLIERFYGSAAFRPERIVLGLMGTPTSAADLRALARGESDRFGVWQVVERQVTQILLESKGTGTASWLAVEALDHGSTKLMFGSWVRRLDQSGWRFFARPHRLYSRLLLGGV